jgi:Domain of unknown function (DUF3825)
MAGIVSEAPPLTGRVPELYDLVWFPSMDWCDDLACVALPETWDDDDSGRHPILFNYFKYYFRRVHEEGLWVEATSRSGAKIAAFDTGLLSRHFQPIYAVFEANRNPDRQPWVHKEWASPSSVQGRGFDVRAMRRALFFSNPAEVVYDPRLEVLPNLEHIVDENVDRYPLELQDDAYGREARLEKAIRVAAARARSNWRLAAPQFYWPAGGGDGRVQLLLPLELMTPGQVDMALVLDRSPSYSEDPEATNACYRAYTVLPLEWAYRNARLITRPEAYWLDINIRAAVGGRLQSAEEGSESSPGVSASPSPSVSPFEAGR